jgi:hypothetical protein
MRTTVEIAPQRRALEGITAMDQLRHHRLATLDRVRRRRRVIATAVGAGATGLAVMFGALLGQQTAQASTPVPAPRQRPPDSTSTTPSPTTAKPHVRREKSPAQTPTLRPPLAPPGNAGGGSQTTSGGS